MAVEVGTERRINAVALGVVVRDGHALLMPMPAWILPDQPWRAIGGFVDFGERAADAVAREWREELGKRVQVLRRLAVVEHRFDLGTVSGHEVTFYFELAFAPGEAPADLAPLPLHEADWSAERAHTYAAWVPVADLRSGAAPTYPADLVEIIGDALR